MWWILLLLYKTTKAQTIINPGYSSSITCGHETDCFIICNETNSCRHSEFYAFNNSITVQCTGYDSCKDSVFFYDVIAPSVSKLICEGDWSCYGSTISTRSDFELYCNTKQTLYSCIYMSIIDGTQNGLSIYLSGSYAISRSVIYSLYHIAPTILCNYFCEDLDSSFIFYAPYFNENCLLSDTGCMQDMEDQNNTSHDIVIIDTQAHDNNYTSSLDFSSFSFDNSSILIITTNKAGNGGSDSTTVDFLPPSISQSHDLSILCIYCKYTNFHLQSISKAIVTNAKYSEGLSHSNFIGPQDEFIINQYLYSYDNSYDLENTNSITINGLLSSTINVQDTNNLYITCNNDKMYPCSKANIIEHTIDPTNINVSLFTKAWTIHNDDNLDQNIDINMYFMSINITCSYNAIVSHSDTTCDFLSFAPTTAPTKTPTAAPTTAPTSTPSIAPTTAPVISPTNAPTISPTTCIDYNISYNSSDGSDIILKKRFADTVNFDGTLYLNDSMIIYEAFVDHNNKKIKTLNRQLIPCISDNVTAIDDIEFCFIQCRFEYGCFETNIKPQNDLESIRIECVEEVSCLEAKLNITNDININDIEIICGGEASCENVQIDLNKLQADSTVTNISLHCNHSLSCLELTMRLNPNGDVLNVNIYCYNKDSCDSLSIHTDHCKEINLNIFMYEFSDDVFIDYQWFSDKDINCGINAEELYIRYDINTLLRDSQIIKLVEKEYLVDKGVQNLPCSGIRVECNGNYEDEIDRKCQMGYEVIEYNQDKILTTSENSHYCYWFDVRDLLGAKCKGNCGQTETFYEYEIKRELDITFDVHNATNHYVKCIFC
eukprot:491406_1